MVKSVTVLGLHDKHSADTALIRDGRVLAAIQEERLTKIKNYSGIRMLSVPAVFKVAYVDPAEVDVIAISGLVRVTAPVKEEGTPRVRLFKKAASHLRSPAVMKALIQTFHKAHRLDELNGILKQLGLWSGSLWRLENNTLGGLMIGNWLVMRGGGSTTPD